MTNADITTNDLTKVYLDGQVTAHAIEKVSFSVVKGTFVAILGPSGCGKSTLLRILAGLVEPSAGTATLLGMPAAKARLTRQVATVFQQPALLPWRTARENARLPSELFRDLEIAHRADHFLSRVGLSDFVEALPREMSGGMQSRTALARAWSMDPKVLLMDEPFSSLDELTRQNMQLLLLELWTTSSATIVFVTHSVAEAVFLADRVLVLSGMPGQVMRDVHVPLARPRLPDLLKDMRYVQLVDNLRKALMEG